MFSPVFCRNHGFDDAVKSLSHKPFLINSFFNKRNPKGFQMHYQQLVENSDAVARVKMINQNNGSDKNFHIFDYRIKKMLKGG